MSILTLRNDFDGDGANDILWRRDDGLLTSWRATPNGLVPNPAISILVPNEWTVAGAGDLNGDGRSDILWRNDDGHLTAWHSNGSGFTPADFNFAVDVGTRFEAVYDLNRDGRDDILWRAPGGLYNWLSDGSSFVQQGSPIPEPARVVGVGDFDGDGYDQNLVRHESGAISIGFGGALQALNNAWQIVGVGDFNGDGRDDILLRQSDGQLTSWLNYGNFFEAGNRAVFAVDVDWDVAAVADLNDDGHDDILWRNEDGTVTQWLSSDDSFNGVGQPFYAVGTDWTVV